MTLRVRAMDAASQSILCYSTPQWCQRGLPEYRLMGTPRSLTKSLGKRWKSWKVSSQKITLNHTSNILYININHLNHYSLNHDSMMCVFLFLDHVMFTILMLQRRSFCVLDVLYQGLADDRTFTAHYRGSCKAAQGDEWPFDICQF